MPLKWLLGQNYSSSIFPEGIDASFLGASEWRKQEAGCTDTCSWGVALLKPTQLVPPQVYDALSIGNGDHRPWSIEKHHTRFCSRKTRSSHATCFVCFHSGKSNPYCEISMGSQSYTTRTLQDTLNPKWNFNCQFFIKDLYQDVLCLTMFDRDQFSPDGKV